MLTAPQVPMLFQGEEWGATSPFLYFTDHPEPDLAEAVRQGRRREFAAFGWRPEQIPDPQDPATRDASVLAWDERAASPHRDLLGWYRALLALRRDEPALRDARQGAVTATADDERGVVVVCRKDLVVVADIGGGGATLTLAEVLVISAVHAVDAVGGSPGSRGSSEAVLASPGSALAGEQAVLAPGGALILRRPRP